MKVSAKMRKLQIRRIIQSFLEENPVVVAAYYDKVKAVNLEHLIALWLDCSKGVSRQDDYLRFQDEYPHAADYRD
jgi:hypothetical protein